MDKEVKKLFIGDLSDLTGLSQRTIRYYEELGLISPIRSEGGFRIYSEENAELLHLIVRFRNLGMSLAEIKSTITPGTGLSNPETLSLLRDALTSRRKEFIHQFDMLKNGIAEIDRLLTFLSKCTECSEASGTNACKNCLLERSASDQSVRTLVTSIVRGGENPIKTQE